MNRKGLRVWETLSRTTILTHNKFLTVESHAVKLPDGHIIPDWAWIIIPSAVIVLAVTADHKFLCFRQTKYAVDGIVLAPVGGMLEGRVGARNLTLTGMLILGAGGFTLAAFHSTGAEIVVAMALIGTGVGLVYSMLAKLIIDAVEPAVTGVAMGMNTVMRTIGGVIGGQVGAAILSASTIPGTGGIPEEQGFTLTFAISGVVAVVGAFGCLLIPRRSRRPGTPAPGPALEPVGGRS